MRKAVVFDNSGTLIERYRVVKDVLNGNIFTDINSLDLIEAADALALVVLQFNTNKLLKLDPDTLVSDVIKEYGIDFDVSFSTRQVSKAEVEEILYNEKSSTVSDITDGFDILREKISQTVRATTTAYRMSPQVPGESGKPASTGNGATSTSVLVPTTSRRVPSITARSRSAIVSLGKNWRSAAVVGASACSPRRMSLPKRTQG